MSISIPRNRKIVTNLLWAAEQKGPFITAVLFDFELFYTIPIS
jgi:hypothetical protein